MGFFIKGKPIIRLLVFYLRSLTHSLNFRCSHPHPFFDNWRQLLGTHVPAADHVMYVRNMNYAASGQPGSPQMLCLWHFVDGLFTGI